MQSVAAPYAPTGNGQYEQPPVVNAADLLSASALSGPGFQVQPQVPTNGAMGQYTITANAEVFKDDAGTYQIESLDLLKIRLSEIPAIALRLKATTMGVSNGATFIPRSCPSHKRSITGCHTATQTEASRYQPKVKLNISL